MMILRLKPLVNFYLNNKKTNKKSQSILFEAVHVAPWDILFVSTVTSIHSQSRQQRISNRGKDTCHYKAWERSDSTYK